MSETKWKIGYEEGENVCATEAVTRGVPLKKLLLTISQNLIESTCARVTLK